MSEFTTFEMRIKEFRKDNKITSGDMSSRDLSRLMVRLVCLFSGVKDSRMEGKVVYSINLLLSCIFLADLAGAENSEDVAEFWEHHHKTYRRVFGVEQIPSHDTFRRILSLVKNEDMNEALSVALKKTFSTLRHVLKIKSPEKRIISVDGKQERGTGRKESSSEEVKDLQTLNVYEQETDTCIYTDPIEVKTNEIPHGQDILRIMNLKGAVVTFDAMHTQRETISIIKDNGGDYVGGLKGNQSSLQEYCDRLFTTESVKKLEEKGGGFFYKTSEIAHNQLEERFFYLHKATRKELEGVFSGWKGLNSIVCFVKHTVNNVDGKENLETRTYISSLSELKDIAYCIRGHWGVENRLHWCLDTVFHEDGMHIADRNAATNQSIINKAALTLCRLVEEFVGKKQKSIRRRRKVFGWDFEGELALMLSFLDEKTFNRIFTVTPKAN